MKLGGYPSAKSQRNTCEREHQRETEKQREGEGEGERSEVKKKNIFTN